MSWKDDIEKILGDRFADGDVFTLGDVYEHEAELAALHPENEHVQEKIRQTLQQLRDDAKVNFLGGGKYRLLGSTGGGNVEMIVLKALYWKRVDVTTWSVLTGTNTQATGGGNHHIAVSARLPVETVLGEFTPPSAPEARERGELRAAITLEDGTEREITVAVDVRGSADSPRREILIRRQFGMGDALPRWGAGAATTTVDASLSVADQPVIYLARDPDGLLIHGWATPDEIAGWPDWIRQPIEGPDKQGVINTNRPPSGYVAGHSLDVLETVLEALDAERNVLIYGPPGTGKTHLMTAISDILRMGWRRIIVAPAATPQVRLEGELEEVWTTFHPSYSYETFIAGYRPKAGGTGFELESMAGVALRATETARAGGLGALLIDELNRGNAARIFGELVTILERGKRTKRDGRRQPTTIPVRLANVDSSTVVEIRGPSGSQAANVPVPYEMPDAVYLVGTMNSVDRSVAPLDAAVRRRFRVVELGADYEGLSAHLGATAVGVAHLSDSAGWCGLAVSLLRAVNERLAHLAGPDFLVGHGYFWSLPQNSADRTRESIISTWREKIFPQLEETFRTRPEALAAALRLDPNEPTPPAGFPYTLRDTPIGLGEAGGMPYVEQGEWAADGSTKEGWLRFLAGLTPAAGIPAQTGGGAVPAGAPTSTSSAASGAAGAHPSVPDAPSPSDESVSEVSSLGPHAALSAGEQAPEDPSSSGDDEPANGSES